jgi:predicted N-acetyltransferase YhbS
MHDVSSEDGAAQAMMIRSIRADDWSSIERIQAESYPLEVLETLEALQSHWLVSSETCLVAETDGDVIGYLLAHPWPERTIPPLNKVYCELPTNSQSLFIHDLALSPKARNSGVADTLVRSVLQVGRQMQLASASLIAVQGSEAFWSRYGFKACHTLPVEIVAAIRRFYPSPDFRYMELEALES